MLKKIGIAYLFLFGMALLINVVLMQKEASQYKNKSFEEVKSVVVEKKAVPVYSQKAGGWSDEIHTKFCYQRSKDTICFSTTATVDEKVGDTIALVVSPDDLTKYGRADQEVLFRLMPFIAVFVGVGHLVAGFILVFANRKARKS